MLIILTSSLVERSVSIFFLHLITCIEIIAKPCNKHKNNAGIKNISYNLTKKNKIQILFLPFICDTAPLKLFYY